MSPVPSPVVVVGRGVAGMATALAAAPAHVVLLCRETIPAGSASMLAQGGIAPAIGAGDSAAAHAADTLEAGAHHNDPATLKWLSEAAPATMAMAAGAGRRLLPDTRWHAAAEAMRAGLAPTASSLAAATSRASRRYGSCPCEPMSSVMSSCAPPSTSNRC